MPNFISRLSTLRRSLLVSAVALVAVVTAVSATSVGTSITTIGITLENGETITNVTDGVVAITSPSTTFSGDTTVIGSDVTIGAAGVKLTGDGDGALTLLGLGDGSDEDLTINLDDTANTIVLSSSTGVTDLDFSGFRFIIDS